MRRGIPKSHVAIMDSEGAILPQVGITQCSPACIFYVWCQNFENLELCKGFKLIENGQNTKHIMRTLGEWDKLYVENSVKDLPNFKPENQEVIVRDVRRILEPLSERNTKEEPASGFGFRAMLDAVSNETDTSSPSKPTIRGFGRGFSGMLDEMCRPSSHKQETFQSVVRHPQHSFKERNPIRRGFGDGVLGMLDQLSRGSEIPATTTKPVHRMIYDEEEEVVHASTFRGVLQDVNRRSEQEIEKKRMKGHNSGFRGMLDAFSEGCSTPIINPILRKLQQRLRAIRNGM